VPPQHEQESKRPDSVHAAKRILALSYVNCYGLIYHVAEQATAEDVIVTDVGFAYQCVSQAWKIKKGQRLLTNGGVAAMGWGLPAAIGACIGTGRRTLLFVGDGGLMFNLQELSTLKHHNLPVKIFLLNNGGYLTMRQSQEHAFDTYMGSDEKSGISFPDFGDIAYANYVLWNRVASSLHVKEAVATALKSTGPWLCEVMMDPNQPQIPKSVNQRDEQGNIRQTPIEDAWPYLPREEIAENLKC
jgi:acetolactate synthase-1/2/3 large subunit